MTRRSCPSAAAQSRSLLSLLFYFCAGYFLLVNIVNEVYFCLLFDNWKWVKRDQGHVNSLTIHLLYAITIVRVNTDMRPNEDDANVSATQQPSQVSPDQDGHQIGMIMWKLGANWTVQSEPVPKQKFESNSWTNFDQTVRRFLTRPKFGQNV